jgi:hypothetical protein
LQDATKAKEPQEAEEGGVTDPSGIIEAVWDIDGDCHNNASRGSHELKPALTLPNLSITQLLGIAITAHPVTCLPL